jgi:hypothetical protein
MLFCAMPDVNIPANPPGELTSGVHVTRFAGAGLEPTMMRLERAELLTQPLPTRGLDRSLRA